MPSGDPIDAPRFRRATASIDAGALPDYLFAGTASHSATSESELHRRRRRRKAATDGKRRDIQGLRMVAVVAVVANHLNGHPRGGFVGVDVFLVISGFLITSHLLRDTGQARSLRSYVADFYRLRIRRLLPAALVVIIATDAVAHVMFNGVRAATAVHDGFWAAVFWANWHFIGVGTNYFTSVGPVSPFQHYWSLSVEEQFYLVWPVILFGSVTALARSRRTTQHDARVVVGLIALCLVIASAIFAGIQSSSAPATAYFSTISRGWELGMGAMLACIVPRLRMRAPVATALSLAGTATIVLSMVFVRGGSGFPMPYALLPCVGASAVVAAVGPMGEARNWLLTNRGAVFIGDISYSVYLVHFPIIVFLSSRMPSKGAFFYGAAVFLTLGLAVLLYSLVERPVLDSGILLPRRLSDTRRDRSPLMRPLLGGLAAAVAGAAMLVAWPGDAATNDAATQRIDAAVQRAAAVTAVKPGPNATPLANSLKLKISQALLATKWPPLHPSISAVLRASAEDGSVAQCAGSKLGPVRQCTWGDPRGKTIELVGDSNAVAWQPAFESLVEHTHGWKLRLAAGYGCSFATKALLGAGPNSSTCAARNRAVVQDIRDTRPAVLVVTNFNAADRYVSSIEAEVASVRPSVGNVVVLGAMPPSIDPRECYVPGSPPSRCVSSVSPLYLSFDANYKSIARSVDGKYVGVMDWLCAGGYCPAFVDGVPTRFDAAHISAPYSSYLGPVLAESLRTLGMVS